MNTGSSLVNPRYEKRNNLIMWVFSGIIALIIYFIGYTYYTDINHSKKAVLDKLSAVVNTTAPLIDGDLHQGLTNEYPDINDITSTTQSERYRELHDILALVQQNNDLQSALYTMVYNPLNESFEFIASSSQYPYYRHTYQQFPKALLDNADTGGTLDVYKSENGQWLSAYAPIKNSKGKTVALIQADQSFERFIKEARMELFQNITLALIVILPFTFLLLTYIKTTLDKDENTRQLLIEKNEQIASKNVQIKENHDKLEAAKMLIEEKNVELNSKVRERTKELLISNKELSTFLYRSSHDIQGPLTTLRGLCHLANKDIIDPEASAYLYMINDTTNKLYHTIKSISNVYEIKSRKVRSEVIRLKPIINQVTASLAQDIDDKGIDLNIEIDDQISIQVDKEIALLVLTELVKNSIEFNSRLNGSTPYIKIIAKLVKRVVCIEVEDNGIGISPDAHKIIFDMFQKGTEKSKGAGLGLYAAKIGTKKLNGQISVDLSNEACTCFKLEFPAA